MAKLSKKEARLRRHRRIRGRISGTAEIPRMSVFCSGRQVYVQFIDDESQRTLASASTLDKSIAEQNVKGNVEGAALIGKIAAERALAANIKQVVFDRAGFRFHGRVKALADASREAGLQF